MRFLSSVFVCIFAGSLLGGVQHYATSPPTPASKVFYPVTVIALCALAATLVLLTKPWPSDAIERRLMALLACFYVGFFLGFWAQKLAGPAGTGVVQMIIASLSFHGAVLIFITRFLHEQESTWTQGFGFANRRPHAILMGLLVALIFLPVGWGLQQASAEAMTRFPYFHFKPEEQAPVHALRVASSWFPRFALGTVAILLAPAAEELLFRGVLYPTIKQAGFPGLALWGTSLVFAAVHLNAVTFVPLTVLALVLTLLYERTDNLLAPITAHAMFNTLNFVTLALLEKTGGP